MKLQDAQLSIRNMMKNSPENVGQQTNHVVLCADPRFAAGAWMVIWSAYRNSGRDLSFLSADHRSRFGADQQNAEIGEASWNPSFHRARRHPAHSSASESAQG